MTDQEPAAAAIKTALTTAFPGSITAYDLDEVPGTNNNPGPKPQQYATISVYRRFVQDRRLGGAVMLPGLQVDVAYHADKVTNIRILRAAGTAALEGVILAGDFGPFTFNDETQPADFDASGGWSAIDTFTF